MVDRIESCSMVYDLHGDGNTGNKMATMETSDGAKGDATTPDHCDECNNGILRMMVATISGHNAVQCTAPAKTA